jgi:hypothetical protein
VLFSAYSLTLDMCVDLSTLNSNITSAQLLSTEKQQAVAQTTTFSAD